MGKIDNFSKSEITNADMDKIRSSIEAEVDTQNGALSVDYNEFKQIYNYVSRYVNRNENKVQNVLFILSANGGATLADDVLERAMYNLNLAVISTLRKVDVGTVFSKNQYIVLLTDTDMVSAKDVATRVKEKYDEIEGVHFSVLEYEIQTMKAKNTHHMY